MNLLELCCSISVDTREYDRGLDSAKSKFSSVADGISGMASKLGQGLANAVKVGAAAITAATAAVGAFAKASIDTGMQFDSAMSQVAAISGAAGDDFDALREKAMQMGASTKFSATESAKAFTYMAMAGWKTEDMLSGIEGIMNLAAASGENLALTSDIVTDALTAFGLAAEDSGHFADVLAAASSNANTNVSMLGESFKYVAPVAGSLGYSAEDTAIALGLMANSGIKASQAGTALRTTLTNMAKPTDSMYVAMQTLGVSLEDGEGNMNSLMDVMQQLRTGFGGGRMSADEFSEKLAELDAQFSDGTGSEEGYAIALERLMVAMYGAEGAQKAELAAMLAGKEGMSGLLAIVNASDEDFAKLTESIYSAEGAAQQMADTMQDNLAGDITIFKSALEGAQIALSDQLTPTLRKFAQFGAESVGRLTEAFQSGGLSGAMEALGGVLSEGLGRITEVIPVAVDAGMQLLGALGQGIIDNLPALAEAAGEIVSMLAAGITENIPGMMSSAGEIMGALASSITGALPGLIGTAGEIVSTLINGLTEAIPGIASTASDIVSALADGLAGQIPTLIPAAVDMVIQLAESLTDPAGLNNMVDSAINLVSALADGLVSALPTLIGEAPVIISNLVSAIATNTPKMMAAGIEIIAKLASGIVSNLPAIIGAVNEIVASFISGIGGYFAKVINVGKDLVNKLGEGVKSLAGNALTWGKDLIDNFVSGITSKISAVTNAVSNVAGEVADYLGFSEPDKGPLSNFHTYAPDMMKLFAQGIKDNAGLLETAFNDSLDFGTRSIDFETATVDFAASSVGRSSAAVINSAAQSASGTGASAPMTFNLVFPDGTKFASYILNPLVEVAKANGTPILNPT